MAATPVNSAPSARALIVMFASVIALTIGLLSLSWHASILDRYEFRQLQTALTTHWIVQEGWHLNYLTPLFGPPWSVPMEFPTYQIIVATVHQFSGIPLEQAGRLTSIAFLFACLPALYDLLSFAGLKPSRRLIVLVVVLTSPVYLFYARTFMIETTALCFAIWFLALFRHALESPHRGWIIATTIAASLAALTKITTFIVFGLPAAALAISSYRAATASADKASTIKRVFLASLIPAGISLGLAWWWIGHSDAVKDSNPFTGFLAAREMHAWNYGPWSLRLDWSFWVHMQETIVGFNLTEGAIAIALFCVPFAPNRSRWMAAAALAGFISGPLIFANLYHVHDYYYAANSLLLLSAAGLMIASIWDDSRLPRGANWLALALVLSFQLHAYYRGYYSHHRNGSPAAPAMAAIIHDAVPADGVVLIYGADWDPLLPYYAQRRALMVPGHREDETDVLEQVLKTLPAQQKIAAMVIHGDKLRARADFIRERVARFGLSPQPVARNSTDELYLPAAIDPSVIAKVAANSSNSVQLLALPADDSISASLKPDAITGFDLSAFHPVPIAVRSKYGVNIGVLDGRKVLNAHAPSELVFHPAPGARHLRAVVGLPDASFAAGRDAITDGITIDIFVAASTGIKQLLFHRQLDPVHAAGDRGPQTIELDLPPAVTGDLILRLGNGPKNDPTNDWAYWAAVDVQ